MNQSTKTRLKQIVGEKNFYDSQEEKLVYSFDGTPIFQQLPEAIVFPTNDDANI